MITQEQTTEFTMFRLLQWVHLFCYLVGLDSMPVLHWQQMAWQHMHL